MDLFKVSFLAFLIVTIPKVSFAEKTFFFEGQVDFQKNEFDIVVDLGDESSLTAKAEKTSERDYRLLLDVEHVKTPLFDLLSKIESSVEVADVVGGSHGVFSDPTFKGKIWSQYSLVDYKPINELSGHFEVKDNNFYLTALSFGNLMCEGYIGLASPHALNVSLGLDGVEMYDFLNFWTGGKKYDSSGIVFGNIKVSGDLGRLQLKGSLEGQNGFVQELDYSAITLNLEGVYPHMSIAQSTITKSDGVSFSLDGSLNLSDTKNFKKQIRALTFAPLVSSSKSELEWTIKRLSPSDSGSTEFKYHSQKGGGFRSGPSVGDEIDMLGIERKKRF